MPLKGDKAKENEFIVKIHMDDKMLLSNSFVQDEDFVKFDEFESDAGTSWGSWKSYML